MSFNIDTVGPVAPQQVRSGAAKAADRGAPAAARAPSDPVKVDAIPSAPPPEVHAAMAVAANAYHKLAASGRELSFRVDDRSGKLTVEVHDVHGNVLFTVPASKALDVAAGGSLD